MSPRTTSTRTYTPIHEPFLAYPTTFLPSHTHIIAVTDSLMHSPLNKRPTSSTSSNIQDAPFPTLAHHHAAKHPTADQISDPCKPPISPRANEPSAIAPPLLTWRRRPERSRSCLPLPPFSQTISATRPASPHLARPTHSASPQLVPSPTYARLRLRSRPLIVDLPRFEETETNVVLPRFEQRTTDIFLLAC